MESNNIVKVISFNNELLKKIESKIDVFTTVVRRGEIIFDEYESPVFSPQTIISEEKIGYFCCVTIKETGKKATTFKSVSEMEKRARAHSCLFANGVGPWIEKFDYMSMKVLKNITIKKILHEVLDMSTIFI